MPRPAGTAKFPLTIAAAVDPALKQRLDDWAAHQQCTPSALLRALIQAHIPDLRQLTRRHSTMSTNGPSTQEQGVP